MPRPGDPGANTPPPVPYRNPFRDVAGLTAGRVDMGVDYQGQGPVYALGPGVITEADNSWAGGVGAVGPGTWIVQKITEGPLAGRYVYLAENVTPTVRVGQTVDSSTVIGTMTGQGAGIETGFAAGPTGGTTAAMAAGQASASGDPGANPTAFGAAYSKLLAGLGAPPGVLGGQQPVGTTPDWLKWLEGGFLGIGGQAAGGAAGGAVGALGGLSEVGHWLGVIVTDLTDIHLYISLGWLWLGLLLLFLGIYLWFRMSDTYRSAEGAALKVAAAAA